MKDRGEANRRKERPHPSLRVYRLAHTLALRADALSLKPPNFETYPQ